MDGQQNLNKCTQTGDCVGWTTAKDDHRFKIFGMNINKIANYLTTTYT